MNTEVVARAALRALLSRRTWADVAYMLVSIPMAVLGFAYAVTVLVLGGALAVTAAGVPLLAAGLGGARRAGGPHRRLARALLGERIPAPAPPRLPPGLLARTQARLADPAGWRAMAYLLLRLPLVLTYPYVLAVTWGWGLVAATYPLQRALGVNETTVRDAAGHVRRGMVLGGFHLEIWPRPLLVSAVGIALLLVAPWAARAILLVDRVLTRRLLGGDRLAERVRDLEETRARAVDDAAATLRRIERDLHDGAQARLVALTMQLTLLRETTPEGPARDLATAAQANAREAVAELRELIRGIHPPVLDSGLDVALGTLAATCPLPVELHADIPERPTAAIESIAYFCAAELLTNAARHSAATRIRLDVRQRDGRLVLRVHDDGAGGAVVGAGSGLPGLLGRVRTVDGRLEVSSPPGGPTVVTVELPSHA